MNVYFDFLIKASVSIGIMYVLYWLLLRNLTHFKANRYFLLASVVLAIICAAFPLKYEVLMQAPAVMQSSEYADQFQRDVANTIVQQPEDSSISIWGILLAVYSIGFALVLLRLLIQSWKPIQIIFRTTPKKIDDYLLHENTVYKMPFSFFNRILIHPEYFKQNEINDILTHEKVHIQERHWIDLFIIELLTVFFWFNPFIWLFERAIKQNHEYLADKGVLSRGQSPVRYQALLINQLMGTKVIGMANHLNFALGPTRFKMMTKEKCSKRKLYRMIWLLPVLALLMYSFAQPEYKVQAQGQKKNETKTVIVPDNKELEHNLTDGTIVTIPGGTTLTYPVKSKKNKGEVKKNDETKFDVSDSKVPFKVKNKKGNINTLSNVEKPKTSKKVPARIKGTVKDENGNPIQGASIILKGSTMGTITDADGKYEFEKPVGENGGLIAIHPGYEQKSNSLSHESGSDYLKHDFIMEAVDSDDKKDQQKAIKVSGTVKDVNGNPMPGTSVVLKGSTLGTVADRQGKYEIEIPAGSKVAFVASFVGYQTHATKGSLPETNKPMEVNFTMKREVIGISANDLKKAGDVPPPPPPPAPETPKDSDELVFYIVEEMPQYPQGFYGLAQHVKKQSANIKESFFFEGKTLKGNATVGFTVNPKGEVNNIQILKKSNEVAAEAAKIIASKMEAWKPGSQRGKKVAVDFAMELEF
ncbi:carboxypeptidase-like regulatory domain-containing protein [Marinifilum sp. D714]|uniref:carboxypeptidase-like regulatory domain-containing protein n=1 Tax=Marinifilum sp. D714 TaxID=2937523 RepID=UPI0027CF5072|nr:carboxypeptidase-like regulatory domain-containing protein [Marinifilum sp. D714]MDQ2177369.1 carboxypeptidase-like regulatory domain-containing protein [Marinifilum sp. D714]